MNGDVPARPIVGTALLHPERVLRAVRSGSQRLAMVGALVSAAVVAAPLRVDRMDFATGSKAAQPSVTVDASEGFVITWQERAGATSTLRFAVLDVEGKERRRGQVSSGPDRFVNGADFPNLAVLDNGDWVTFWLQKTESGTYAYEIRTIRSRDKGHTWDEPVVVHGDGTPTEHGFVSMSPAGEDRVRLIWLDGRRMAVSADAHGEGGDEHMTLRSAILARAGTPTQERELDTLTCACCQTDMARGTEDTVAVYRDRTGTEIRDVAAVVFDDKGVTEPAIVHDDAWKMPGCPVNGPALAVRGDRFLVVWPTMATGTMEVRAALGNGGSFNSPRTLARGESELGRVDAAAFANGWLVSRVTTQDSNSTLTLTRLAGDGSPDPDLAVAFPAGGYPRMAVHDRTVLLVVTEPVPGGDSRIAVYRAAEE